MPKKNENLKGEKQESMSAAQVSEFWRTLDSKTVKLNDTDNYYLYEDFVNSQREAFVNSLEKVNKIIDRLKLEGKISEYAMWKARIKHFENALNNVSFNEQSPGKGKALDDVFGVRIIRASEAELDIIQSELEKEFTLIGKKKDSPNTLYNIQRMKEISQTTVKELKKKARNGNKYSALVAIFETVTGAMDKAKEVVEDIYKKEERKKTSRERGYNARHRYYYSKDDEKAPLIEFQYWTVELDYQCTYGSLSYSNYKDLEKEEIQRMYDEDRFRLGNNISIMYESVDGKVVRLSSKDALKRTYPFLNMNKQKAQETQTQSGNTDMGER